MTIKETLSWLRDNLSQKYDTQESSQLARHLVQWVLDKPDSFLITHQDTQVSKESIDLLYKALEQHLTNNKPLQYIFGTAPFLSSMIMIRPPTLIPRPETESWTHTIINYLKKLNKPKLTLLDMCTGSGCIAVSLAQAFPEATVYAVDKSPEALELTKENAQHNNVTNIITIKSDLFENVPDILFDCIVSNPPYVTQKEWETLDPGVKDWEDQQALVAQDHGLSIIKRIISEAPNRLKRDPLYTIPQLVIEIGETQGKTVADLMSYAGFKTQIHKDDAGKERFVTGVLNGK